MRVVSLLLATSCLLGVAAAQSQENASTNATGGTGDDATFTLIAELMGGEYVWVDTEGNENPTLRVLPNSRATIHIQQGETTRDVPHDIQVGGGEKSEQISAPGDTASVTFNVPPTGSLSYVCSIHPSSMKGTIEITEDIEESRGDDGVPAPGVLAILVLVAIVALVALRRRA